jgi:hypothetical protein
MGCIRWKWLPLVLLLSPLVYFIGVWASSWCLEPKPRYSMNYQPEQKVSYVHPVGSYLVVSSNVSSSRAGYDESYHHLKDGKHIHTTRSLTGQEGFERERLGDISEGVNELKSKAYRYDVSRKKFSESSDYILDDNETGKHYRFIKQPRGIYYLEEMNKSQTYCLIEQDRKEWFSVKLLEGMCGLFPFDCAANLLSVMQLKPSVAYWQNAEILSVISIPDKRVIASDIVNPFKAYRQHHHGRITIRGLSPSGRWIVMGDDSEHATGKSFENEWTNIYVYDTVKHRWLDTVTNFRVVFDSSPEFLCDDLIQLRTRDYSSGTFAKHYFAVHLPSGNVLEEGKGLLNVDLSAIQDNEQEYCSYLKKQDFQEVNSRLTTILVNKTGKASKVHEKTFPFRLTTSSPCSGFQVFCDKWFDLNLPKWMEEWFPKGKIHDLIQKWRMQQACFVYDFPNDQIVVSWPHGWNGNVSDDGKTLVMNYDDADYHVRRAEVYDLPFPVWSPWWSRGTGIGLLLLLSLFLVRRRGRGKHASSVN